LERRVGALEKTIFHQNSGVENKDGIELPSPFLKIGCALSRGEERQETLPPGGKTNCWKRISLGGELCYLGLERIEE